MYMNRQKSTLTRTIIGSKLGEAQVPLRKLQSLTKHIGNNLGHSCMKAWLQLSSKLLHTKVSFSSSKTTKQQQKATKQSTKIGEEQ